MLENILDFEREAFLLCNGSDSAFLDRFMWLYTDKEVWFPLAFFIIILLVYKKKWKESILILLAIVLVVTLCDQFASHVCKPMFTRLRPTHHPEFMNEVKVLFDYRGGRYGFISSHAANAFGFATFMALLLRNKFFTVTIFFWAALMAYSRIYLGVHFISDIIPGALVGTIFGYLVYRLYGVTRNLTINRVGEITHSAYSLYAESTKQLITGGIILMILILIAFNGPLLVVFG